MAVTPLVVLALVLAPARATFAQTEQTGAPPAPARAQSDEKRERRLVASPALDESLEPARRIVAGIEDPVLRDLARLALAANPQIAALAAHADAASRLPDQVGAPPDPRVGTTVWISPPETRVGPQQLMFTASQTIPWKGKLALREEAAGLDAAALRSRAEALRVEVVTEVRRWYLELAYLDAEAAVIAEELSILEHFDELARSRYEAGTGLQQGPIKIQAEITRTQLRLLDLDARRATTLAALNSLLARPSETLVTASAITTGRVGLDLPALRAIALTRRPEIEATDHAIAAADTRVERARKERYPDITGGLTYTLVGRREDAPGRLSPPPDDGQDVFGLTASLNLPVWKRKIFAGVEEAVARRQAAGHDKTAVLTAIDRQIYDALTRLRTAADQLELYERVLAPQAEQSVESVLSAYSAGSTGALDLLDAQRVAFAVRVGIVRVRTDHAIARARLEGAVSDPLLPIDRDGGVSPARAEGTP